MPRTMHINASPRGAASQSLALATAFLDALDGNYEVDRLDLFEDPLPEFGTMAAAAKMAAFSGQEATPEQMAVWNQCREVFDRFASADAYVFNVPMWNAGVPYRLKQWIDIITQPGWAFGFDPAVGYSGLVTGKRAFVSYTSGVYKSGVPLEFGANFAATFFDDWLRFVGITDVTRVNFQPTVLTATPEEDFRLALSEASKLGASFPLS